MHERTRVEHEFTIKLPKAELHAHLSGSVDVECLRRIWMYKQANNQCLDLEDPAVAIRPGGRYHDVISFFPLFDKYIYGLCNDLETVKDMTIAVLKNFLADGVRHLELRTTPRANVYSGLTQEAYVVGVLEAIRDFSSVNRGMLGMETTLILSIDRRMTAEQAESIVDLAVKFQHPARRHSATSSSTSNIDRVVGIDLCGNPTKGNVASFTNAFTRAKESGLGITVHFAEIPLSSSDDELNTILSWNPDRLGHAIHVNSQFANIIEDRRLGMELCLSCNVLAKMTSGGYAMHHLGKWRRTQCPIALSTDDVGVFGSALSNEYLLAAEHFKLSQEELIGLCRSAAAAVFSGRQRLDKLIDQFENDYE